MKRESRRESEPRLIPWLRRDAAPVCRDLALRALAGPRRFAPIDRALRASVDYLLDCRTVRRHLSDALDDQVPQWTKALIRAHLSTCQACPRVDASMRDTVDLLRSLREGP